MPPPPWWPTAPGCGTCTSRPRSPWCSRSSLLPWILLRLIDRLEAQWDSEPLINIPTTMLVGVGLVIFAFGLAQPISALATTITRNTIGIALASSCSPS